MFNCLDTYPNPNFHIHVCKTSKSICNSRQNPRIDVTDPLRLATVQVGTAVVAAKERTWN